MLRRSLLPRILFFAFIALLMVAEFWVSNLSSLTNNLAGTAAQMGLGVAAERTHLLILMALDTIAALGALIALIGCLRDRTRMRRVGTLIAAPGLLLYGLYQLGSALTQLSVELRGTIVLSGLIHIGIGILTWIVGTRPTPDVHPSR